ncbi:heparinase II/III domain-containing protein, partial [Enterococcus faecalis]|uniref:heparinase II/III domain-containing protein n=1 Tax=Enterococcus faecalis TaxID=1351 RepID=UPI003D6ADBA3
LVTSQQSALIWDRLTEQLDLQFYSDGIHWEQSALYQYEVLMTYVYLLQISEYLEISLPLDLRTKLKIPILSTYYITDNQDVLNPINDSDHVNFRYVYDSYRNMKKELGKHCSQRNFFRGESSGLVFYKTEDIYFTLFNGLHGSSHGHASTGSFTLQLQGDDLISDSGCYSYVNKAEWLQPKECDSHNTMFIAENSHTLVLIHGATGNYQPHYFSE